jgi:hypothetical protein
MARRASSRTFGEISMTITRLRFAGICILVIAGAATSWLIQHQSEITLRQKISSLQTQLDQLNQQRIKQEQFSDLLAQTGSPLPSDQMRELLRLRGEVGLLRKQTNELHKLQVENRQLRSDQVSGKSQRQPSLAAGDSVPVESLAFAGYDTPEAAFQSTLSAEAKGDFKTFLEGFTPERRQAEEKGITGIIRKRTCGQSS